MPAGSPVRRWAALERQNAQDEVAKVLSLIEAGALTGDYEWTVWETSAAE
jgi:hypothetical protein